MTASAPTNTVAYYVGDLCYVIKDEWREVCNIVSYTNEESAYQLEDGRNFFMLSTAYGDGTYNDQQGRSYSVDSGSIGAVKVSDIGDATLTLALENGLGQVVEFPYELTEADCFYDDGTLVFGGVEIETTYNDDDDITDEEDDEDA